MKRLNVLVCSGMLPGHVQPYLAVSQALRARGHRVHFYAEPYAAPLIRPTGARFIASAAPQVTAQFLRRRTLRGQVSVMHEFARAVLPDVVRRLQSLRIDVALIDQMNLGAALAVTGCEVPWGSLAISPPVLSPGLHDWPNLVPTEGLRRSLGLPETHANSLEQGISPHLFILPWVRAADLHRPPAHSQYVGNIYASIQPAPELRAWLGSSRSTPRVLVSMSTSPDRSLSRVLKQFNRRLLEALSAMPVRAIITGANVDRPAHLPPHVRIEPFVDHSSILDRVDLLVNHGGWGTMSKAVAAGASVLIVPFERDNHENGRVVENLGVGQCHEPETLTVPALTRVIGQLAAPGNRYSARSKALVKVFRRAGGVKRMAGLVEELAR